MSDNRYRLKAQIALEADGSHEQLVVVDGRTGSMWISNDSARPLLEQLRRGASEINLVDVLVSRFSLEHRRAVRDVRHFLGALSAMDVVDVLLSESSAEAPRLGTVVNVAG